MPSRLLRSTLRALCLLLCVVALCPSADHPRLLIGAADLPALRDKITAQPIQGMYEHLVAHWDAGNYGMGSSVPATDYDECTNMVNAGFLYALTGDDLWAQRARTLVENRLADSRWGATSTKGLSLDMHGKAVALAFDFCYDAPSWSGFTTTVSQQLLVQANVIYSNGGTEQNTNTASNWQGNRYAAAGLCYLACDETVPAANLDGCFAKVNLYITSNMGTGSANRGWNSEGFGYTTYPWGNFIGPYGIAQKRLKNQDIRDCSPTAVDYALWTVYASTCRIDPWLHPDFGDDNAGVGLEGTAGQAFYYCPPALRPGLAFWYDRMFGANGNGTYDNSRAGTIYSILYHPGAAVVPQDPMTIPEWRAAFVDTDGNGYQTFRNRYQDADDLVAQLYVKLRGNRGHNGPDALGFRILGLDTAWAVGGGRYGTKTNGQDVYLRSQNSLYPVDPDATLTTNGNSGVLVGTPVVGADGSGSVVASITRNNCNVVDHKRRFLADYSTASGASAAYVISDTSSDGRWWQLCTLEANAITTSGNTFTITSPTGASLRGTVLYPATAQFTTGVRVRGSGYGYHGVDYANDRFIHTQSADGDHLIVLTVVPPGGAHPAVALIGDGPVGCAVAVGGLTVAVGDDTIAPKTSNLPPTVALTAPLAGAGYTMPADVVLTADADDADGGVATVEFFANGTKVGEATAAPWTCTWTNAPAGTHALTAVATDDNGATTVSSAVGITVFASNEAPVVGAVAADPATVTGTTATLTATASDDRPLSELVYDWSVRSAPAGGTATFSIDASQAAVSTVATFTRAGTYVLDVAVTDAGGLTGTGSATVVVAATVSAIAVTPAAVPVLAGASASFAVSANDQFGQAIVPPPSVAWTVDAGGPGTVDAAGCFTATAAASGPATVRAGVGAVSGTATAAVLYAVPGLKAEFVDYTTALTALPDLTSATPNLVRTDAQVAYASVSAAWGGLPTTMSDTFASRHTGFLRVDTAGSYILSISSDDGSKVWLDGALLINNDGPHGMGEKTATIALAAGWHPLRIEYYDNSGANGLELRWTPPGSAKAIIPASALWRSPPAGTAPTIPALTATTVAAGGKTSTLACTASDDGGEPLLTYGWSVVTAPAGGTVAFSASGTNAAKTATATFSRPGGHVLRVTVNDRDGSEQTATVAVDVPATLTSVSLTPTTVVLLQGDSQAFSAVALDQFSQALSPQPAIAWTLVSGSGSVSASGIYTAPATGTGSASVRATAGTKSATASITYVPPMPVPWTSLGINAPATPGYGIHLGQVNGGEGLTVAGAGSDIAGTSDQFHLVAQAFSGDGQFIARIASQTNTNAAAKAGIMVRDGTAANARHVSLLVTPTSGAQLTARLAAGGATTVTTLTGWKAPCWVKVVRSGSTLSGFVSADGIAWTQVGANQTLGLPATAQVGVAVTSKSTGTRSVVQCEGVVLLPVGGG